MIYHRNSVFLTITCNNCACSDNIVADDAIGARDIAETFGWVTDKSSARSLADGGTDMCGDCFGSMVGVSKTELERLSWTLQHQN